MAKGRKLTTSRSERLLGSYSYGHGGQGSNGTDTSSSELGEEDVWSMVDNMADHEDHVIVNNNSNISSSSQGEYSSRASGEGNGTVSIRSRRRILRDDRNVGGLSLAFDDSGKTMTTTTTETMMTTATTASSRILHQFRGGNNNESVGDSPRGGHHMATSAPVNVPDWSKILRVDSVESLQGLDDRMEDGDSEMVPPHEYLAREYTRRQEIAATSVFEGMGRTLKGRDLRRVRDAVWSQTGFDG